MPLSQALARRPPEAARPRRPAQSGLAEAPDVQQRGADCGRAFSVASSVVGRRIDVGVREAEQELVAAALEAVAIGAEAEPRATDLRTCGETMGKFTFQVVRSSRCASTNSCQTRGSSTSSSVAARRRCRHESRDAVPVDEVLAESFL